MAMLPDDRPEARPMGDEGPGERPDDPDNLTDAERERLGRKLHASLHADPNRVPTEWPWDSIPAELRSAMCDAASALYLAGRDDERKLSHDQASDALTAERGLLVAVNQRADEWAQRAHAAERELADWKARDAKSFPGVGAFTAACERADAAERKLADVLRRVREEDRSYRGENALTYCTVLRHAVPEAFTPEGGSDAG